MVDKKSIPLKSRKVTLPSRDFESENQELDLQIKNHPLVWSLPGIIIENAAMFLWLLFLLIVLFKNSRKAVYN